LDFAQFAWQAETGIFRHAEIFIITDILLSNPLSYVIAIPLQIVPLRNRPRTIFMLLLKLL
jgi:hypothetical protein